jgi:TPP-dependent indolepyruvate ferredoxin oxidoreductase alpha subunit
MELSQKLKMPFFIRSTTRTCHQMGKVEFAPCKTWDQAPEWDNELMLRDGGYVPLPGTLDVLKTKALKRLKLAGEEMEKSGLNQVVKIGKGDPALRVISFGHTFQALESALDHLGQSAEVLKLAQTNPLPKGIIREFLQTPARYGCWKSWTRSWSRRSNPWPMKRTCRPRWWASGAGMTRPS